MTSVDRQRPRWLLTSPDVVANLRWVIFGMLCLEAISGFYDYAVDPDLGVDLVFLAQSASALAAGAALLWRAHLLGLCFFVLMVVLTAINDPIGIDLLVLVLLFFLIGLRAGPRLAIIGVVGGVLLSTAFGIRNEYYLPGEGWQAGPLLSAFCFTGGLAGLLVRMALRAVERALRRARELEVETVLIRRQERRRLSADLQLVLDEGLSELERMTAAANDATVPQLLEVLKRVDAMSRQLMAQTHALLEALRPTKPLADAKAPTVANRPALRWVRRSAAAVCLTLAVLIAVVSEGSTVSTWVAVLAWSSAALAFWRPVVGIFGAASCLAVVVITIMVGGAPGRWDVIATAVLCMVISVHFPRWIGALVVSGIPFLLFVALVEPDDSLHAPTHIYAGAVALLIGWSWQYLQARQSEATSEFLRSSEQRDHVVDQERESLARELHDVVAHQLSIVSMMIMACSATTERGALREVVMRLHDNTASAQSELDALVAGLKVEASRTGRHVTPTRMAFNLAKRLDEQGFHAQMHIDPASDELEPVQMITVVRVMQEATTNILRYAAPGASCDFMVTVGPFTITAEVESELSSTPRRSPLSSGRGLRGLRERTDLLGGSFESGPRHGRWVVSMQLPHHQVEADKRVKRSVAIT
ncbi:MAG: histidine kinase [Propionibacteriaceae bacterium]|nr:histidine kinase [Propionibacteriaceae bacterium]